LSLIHPYDVIILYCTLGLFTLERCRVASRRRAELTRFALLVAATTPGLAVGAWNFAQTLRLTPDDYAFPLQRAVVEWGVLCLLALAGGVHVLRSGAPLSRPTAWALTSSAALVVMLHLEPFYFRRKLILGGTMALAGLGMGVWPSRWPPRLALLALCLPMHVLVLGSALADLSSPDCPLYQTPTQAQALRSLSKQEGPGAVLCQGNQRSLVPMLAGRRVFAGYAVLVEGRRQREAELERFFAADTPPSWRLAFLRAHPRIRWVLWPDGRLQDVGR
jgi:hypothetical protein